MVKRLLFTLVFVLALLCVAGCNDGDDVNVVEPDRLEYLDPTPISVGADDADQVIQDVREARESVNQLSYLINVSNCKLGFSSCITANLDYDADLWRVENDD